MNFIRVPTRGLRFHLKIMKTFPKETYKTIGQEYVQAVSQTKDGEVFVAWHPDVEFPYECTKPIPPPAEQVNSLLKLESLKSSMDAFSPAKKERMVAEELARATYTCKHRWFPRARDKKAKKTPMDREYL